MSDLTTAAAALSDTGRVRILASLFEGELCVCQILELIDLAPSTISKHLSVLRDAGLIEGRKQGRWMYYRLSDDATPAAQLALGWVRAALDGDPAIAADSQRLKCICTLDPQTITSLQRQRRCC